jgi:glycosyltransferase involved in cell wall biosynthesis
MMAQETEKISKPTETNPPVSIIIATYKQHTSLPIAIYSALSQTYPNVEVVVVSVRSDMETLWTLKPFRSMNVKVVVSEYADYVHQRNLGVLSSNGKWFKWLDSDDYLLPGAVQADLTVALREKAYVVYSPLLQADQHFNIVDFIKTEDFTYEALTKNCFITDSSLTLKAMAYEFGLDMKKGDMAFYDFWLKIAEKYPDRIKLNMFPGLVYCQHEGQMSRQVPKPERDRRRAAVVAESLERVRNKK